MTKYEWIKNELELEGISLNYAQIHGILIGEHFESDAINDLVFEIFVESKEYKGLI